MCVGRPVHSFLIMVIAEQIKKIYQCNHLLQYYVSYIKFYM